MPVDSRTLCDISTSAYSLAVDDVENCEKRLVVGVPAGDSARSSTSEFHAPHSVQRPIHLGACAPHSWQTNTTLGGFTGAHSYWLSISVPRRHTTPHGRVPSAPAISRASMRCQLSSPCRPSNTTS